jgi:hypothetical protein
MFSRIRRRITYANVAMTLALVFAMSGGAYAASKYLITSTKQISPKVLKALKGKTGTNGTNGINGMNGAAGAQGPQGAKGDTGGAGSPGAKGDTGGAGSPGTPGKSVVSAEFSGAHAGCSEERGGSEFEVASSGVKHYACNGSPWTAGGTLPIGQSETGTWADIGDKEEGKVFGVSISFPIQLKTALIGAVFQEESEWKSSSSTHCRGTEGAPTAEAGYLCVYMEGEYVSDEIEAGVEPQTVGLVGAIMAVKAKLRPAPAFDETFATGTWAVKAA